jgi:hypothetical protein
MSYLPTKYSTRPVYYDTPVIDFLQAYEPDDKAEARKFRESLMKALNYYLPNGNKVVEHPDSFYLEP